MLKKFLPQIIAMLFLAGFVAYAWTEPAGAPPGGNVEPPVNIGSVSQYKSGALGIGGLLRGYSDAIFDGRVGIGTVSPGAKLDVQGGNVKVGSVTIADDGSVSTNLNADKLDGLDPADIIRQGLYGYCDTQHGTIPLLPALRVGTQGCACQGDYQAVITGGGKRFRPDLYLL